MASKNTIREYAEDTMYHVYNRGVEKRDIFCDDRDYAVFLSFLKYALLSDEESRTNSLVDSDSISAADRFNLRRLGLAREVDLVAFCLMPNHFHLLLFQHSVDGITKLMRSIATGYSIYFNKRYDRVGGLYQGRYKASRIQSDSYWQHISRYIHLNPLDVSNDYKAYPYSSYRYYSGAAEAEWVKRNWILDDFKSSLDYERFTDDYVPRRAELDDIKHLLANAGE